MKMNMDDDDKELDLFFAAAKEDTPLPSAELLKRIEADAEALMVPPAQPVKGGAEGRARPGSVIRDILAALGGWPAAAGLASAALAGVWIGISPPDSFNDFTTTYLTGSVDYTETLDYGFGFEAALLEDDA